MRLIVLSNDEKETRRTSKQYLENPKQYFTGDVTVYLAMDLIKLTTMKTEEKTETEVWPDGNDFWASRIWFLVKLEVHEKSIIYLLRTLDSPWEIKRERGLKKKQTKKQTKQYPVSQISLVTFGLQVSQKCGLGSDTMLFENSVSIKTSNCPRRSACQIFHDFLQPLAMYDRTSAYFLFFWYASRGNICRTIAEVTQALETRSTQHDVSFYSRKGWVWTESRQTDLQPISCPRGRSAWYSGRRSRIPLREGESYQSKRAPELRELEPKKKLFKFITWM